MTVTTLLDGEGGRWYPAETPGWWELELPHRAEYAEYPRSEIEATWPPVIEVVES